MPFARICILLVGLLAPIGVAVAAEVRPPATLAEAGRMEAPQGWSLAQMANGRPVALYRGPAGTGRFLALSCINNGRARLVGGPESYLVWGTDRDTRIVTLHPEDGRSHGVSFLFSLSFPEHATGNLRMGSDHVLDEAGRGVIRQVSEVCGKMDPHAIAEDGRGVVVDDVTWTTWQKGALLFGVPASDAYVGLGFSCSRRVLRLMSYHVPDDVRDGGTTPFRLRLDTADWTFRAKIERNEVQDSSQVKIDRQQDFLGALAKARALQVRVGGSDPFDVPTAGLDVLVPLALGECMAKGAVR